MSELISSDATDIEAMTLQEAFTELPLAIRREAGFEYVIARLKAAAPDCDDPLAVENAVAFLETNRANEHAYVEALMLKLRGALKAAL